MNTAPSKIIVKLYPNIGSLAIEENNHAINLNIVNAANEKSHGTIRFSCSYKLKKILILVLSVSIKYVILIIKIIFYLT